MKKSVLVALSCLGLADASWLGLGASIQIPSSDIEGVIPQRIEPFALVQITQYGQLRSSWMKNEIENSQGKTTESVRGWQLLAYPMPGLPLHADLGWARHKIARNSELGDASWDEYWTGLGAYWKPEPRLSLDLQAGQLWCDPHDTPDGSVSASGLALRFSVMVSLW